MEATIAEENINVAGKESVEIIHTENMITDGKEVEEPSLTPAQARNLMLKLDLKVLPMLGVIYAVSIIDRINVRLECLPCVNLPNVSRLVPPKSSACRQTSISELVLATRSFCCFSFPRTFLLMCPPTGL